MRSWRSIILPILFLLLTGATWSTGQSDVQVASPWDENGTKHDIDTDDVFKLYLDGSGKFFWSWNKKRRPMLRFDLDGFPGDWDEITGVTFHSVVDTINVGGHGENTAFNQIDPQCSAAIPNSSQAAEFDSGTCDWNEMSDAAGNDWIAPGGDILDDNGGGEADLTFPLAGPTSTGDWDTSNSNLIDMVQRAHDDHGDVFLIRIKWADESPFFGPGEDENDYREDIDLADTTDATDYPKIEITYTSGRRVFFID